MVKSALLSPNTGVIDFAMVAKALAEDIKGSKRGHVVTRFEVHMAAHCSAKYSL